MESPGLSIDDARSAVQERKTTALALVEEHYTQIQKEDGQIGAFLTLCNERALEQADRIDRMAVEGKPLPPLGGVPVAIKDVMSTRGLRTTAGSKILNKYIPPFDCTAVERMEAAGAGITCQNECGGVGLGGFKEEFAVPPGGSPPGLWGGAGGVSCGSAAGVCAGPG